MDNRYPFGKRWRKDRERNRNTPARAETLKIYKKEWERNHPPEERRATGPKVKFCKSCGTFKFTEEFYQNDSRHDGWSRFCKDCTKFLARKRYHERKQNETRTTTKSYGNV